MLDVIFDKMKKVISSRLFPITIIYVFLFALIIHRLFVLQIVEGPEHSDDFSFKTTKEREIKSTRGNFYDRNGNLLASNVLSYSVTIEDLTSIKTNEERNAIVHQLITIIEENGDTLDHKFAIALNDDGELEFTVEGATLTRFKRNAFAYVLEDNNLTDSQQNATAEEVFDFLRYGTRDNYTRMFDISDDYSIEEALKIMNVRYALFSNYPKYLQITVASRVSDSTVAAVMEHRAEMPSVNIQHQTHRVYEDSVYFAHILGYTGLVSAEELTNYEKETDYYNSTDVIGKGGLEQYFESYLGGRKGSEIVTVNTSGKVIEVVDRVDPIAGNDVYLTIDRDLQKAAYHILEKKIAGILLDKLQPDMNYGSKGESASDILTPIYEVYFALINNNIIDINHFTAEDATDLERQVYNKYQSNLNQVFQRLDTLLAMDNTITNRASSMEDYLNYFYQTMDRNGLLLTNRIDQDDPTYQAYRNNNISLSKFIQYALANNYIDLAKLGIGDEYHDAEESYAKLIDYVKNILYNDTTFMKKIYRELIFSYNLSGTEICLLLFDQNVLEYNQDDINRLRNRTLSAYQFIKNKLTSLEITPGMLAIEPYSGSLVVTDVNSGDVIAMVTYPSYDNNMLANKVDPEYYSKLLNDNARPLLNRPTSQRTAPGSTFKMLSAIAALEEGVVTPTEKIRDLGIFDKILPAAKCHIYPGSHGLVDLTSSLRVSCNYYYYELGYRLSIDRTGRYRKDLGIQRLAHWARRLGLGEKTGIEVFETNPLVSDTDPIRSAIGQGSNDYTPVHIAKYVTTIANGGTNYNLTLLDKIVNKNGQLILNKQPEIAQDLSDIKPSTWKGVQQGMYAVVNEERGSVYNLYRDLDLTVAGKTGTSQISNSIPNNALFVSYAPVEEPEISVTAVIPNGYTSSNAADLTKDIYKYYYNLEDQNDLIDNYVTLPDSNIAAFSD